MDAARTARSGSESMSLSNTRDSQRQICFLAVAVAIVAAQIGAPVVWGQAVNPGRVNVTTTPWSVNWLTHANDGAGLTDLGVHAWVQAWLDDPNAYAHAESTVQDIAIDVRWTGATGDGSTDDTAAVQLAVDKLASTGGRVVFPRGTYVVEGITLGSGITLAGDDGATLKLKANASEGIVDANAESHITIAGLIFDDNVSNQTDEPNVPLTRWTVRLRDCDYCRVRDCMFVNPLETGVDLYLSAYCWVDSCIFTGQTSGTPTETANCDVHATSCSYVWVTDNVMAHTEPADVNHAIEGVYFSGVTHGWITDNVILYGGRGTGGGHQGGAIDLYSSTNTDIHVAGNAIAEYVYIGVRVRGSDVWVSDNYIDANDTLATGSGNGVEVSDTTAGANRVAIRGNRIRVPDTADAVYVVSSDAATEPNHTDVRIEGNTITGASRGVHINRGCVGAQIIGNRISGAVNQGIKLIADPNMELSQVVVANNILDMTGGNNVQAIEVNVTEYAAVSGNQIVNAYQGIGCWVPSGGTLRGNDIEASSYELLFYDETQDMLAYGNRILGTGNTVYREGSEDVIYINTEQEENGSFTCTIWDDDDWDDEAVPVWQAPIGYGVTITRVRATTMGTSSPALDYNVEERAFGALGSAGTDIYAADQAADADGENEDTFSNAAIAAGAHLVFATGTSAETGTVDCITVVVYYTRDW